MTSAVNWYYINEKKKLGTKKQPVVVNDEHYQDSKNTKQKTLELYAQRRFNRCLYAYFESSTSMCKAQQQSEVFKATELHSLLAVERQQGWVSEHTQLMLSVSRLGEVIRALSTATFLGMTGITWVNHKLCCDHRLIKT